MNMAQNEANQLDKIQKTLLFVLFVGGIFFAIYILAAYAWSGFFRRFDLWNTLLGNLYIPGKALATIGIGIHVFSGAVIVAIGPLQLLPSIRNNSPKFHRYAGRVYLSAAMLACLGGNTFILMNGTVGGWVMSVAFSLYGILLGIFAIQAGRFAYRKQFERHRRWALRLFALGIGPLLYRFEYGLWAAINGGLIGHTQNWQGPLDYVMDFFFYIPNLIICELYLFLADRKDQSNAARYTLRVATVGFILILCLGLLIVLPKWWYPVVKMIWVKIH